MYNSFIISDFISGTVEFERICMILGLRATCYYYDYYYYYYNCYHYYYYNNLVIKYQSFWLSRVKRPELHGFGLDTEEGCVRRSSKIAS